MRVHHAGNHLLVVFAPWRVWKCFGVLDGFCVFLGTCHDGFYAFGSRGDVYLRQACGIDWVM